MDYRYLFFINFVALFIFLVAKASILLRILRLRNCTGLSGNTQIMYAISLIARIVHSFNGYFNRPVEYYVFVYIEVILLLTVFVINLSIYCLYKKSYEKEYDYTKIWRLIIPCVLVAVLVNRNESYSWYYSVYLDTVAIIPQMYFIENAKHVEKYVTTYMCFLTIHKSVVLINELNKQINNDKYYDNINMACALIQIIVLCDFLVRLELNKKQKNSTKDVEMPTQLDSSTTNNTRFNHSMNDIILSPSTLNDKNYKSNASVLPVVQC